MGVTCPDLKSLNPCYIACQSVLSEENLEDGYLFLLMTVKLQLRKSSNGQVSCAEIWGAEPPTNLKGINFYF